VKKKGKKEEGENTKRKPDSRTKKRRASPLPHVLNALLASKYTTHDAEKTLVDFVLHLVEVLHRLVE
jgi:hypothetical protein